MKKDLGNVAKHTAIYGLGIAVSRLTSFIMIPIYTHYLTPEDYGILELLTMTLDIVATFIGLRLSSGVIRFYYQYDNIKEKNEVISSSLISAMFLFLFFSALFCYHSHVFSNLVFNSDDYTKLFRILFINLFFTSCIQIPLAYIRALQKSTLFITISFSRLIIQLSLNIYFLVFLGMKVEGVLYSSLAASACVGIYLAFLTLREVGIVVNKDKLIEIVKFTAPLVLSFFGMFILTYSDRYFLKHFCSLEIVGTYSLGYKFGYVVSSFVMVPFGRIWSVYQYQIVKQEDSRYQFKKFFSYLNLVLISSSLGMAIFSYEIIKIMADPAYVDAYRIIVFILATYIVYSWFHFTHIGILLEKKTSYLAVSTLFAAACMIFFNLILIPYFADFGAAIGTFFAYLIRFLIVYIISQRLYRIEYEWRKISILLFYAITAYFLSVLMGRDSILYSLIIKSFVYLIFLVAVYFSPILDSSEKVKIKAFVRRSYSTFHEKLHMYNNGKN